MHIHVFKVRLHSFGKSKQVIKEQFRPQLPTDGVLGVPKESPKQFFHHFAVTVLVRMRERVADWRHRPTNGSKLCVMVTEAVTNAQVLPSGGMG